MTAPTAPPDDLFDVAIVGYGPVGAFGALLLAHAGLRVVLIDRETDIVDIPRAVGLDGEIVRAFARLGHGETIEALLQPPRDPDEVCFTNSNHEPYFSLSVPQVGLNGYRDVAMFDQPELEAAIRTLIADRGDVTERLGFEVTAIADSEDEVEIAVRDVGSGATDRVRARYAIGCDGASSFVRESLGIAWQSLGYDQDWLVIDIVVDSESALPSRIMQVCDPARLTTYICGKDPYRRWEFQLLPGETREEMLRPERIRSLLDDWIPADQYRLRRSAVYQFHAATADRWQQGRIFLAGDAAHQTPPFLGQGLNAGFRDVINLGWKLPLVLAGTCDAKLLETYAAERDHHARDLVEWAVAIGKLMENLAAGEAGRPPPHGEGADQSSGYGQGRTAPPLLGGVIQVDQQDEHSPTGFLFRQPTVRTPNGETCRLDALLGNGFALVARNESDLALAAECTAFLDRIGARRVSLDGVEAVEGTFDRLLDDHAAAIVRPDGYVFGVTDAEHSLDGLVRSLEAKLAIRSTA